MKKKIYTNVAMLALMLMSVLTFTSCDSDEMDAYNLDGDWYGDLNAIYYDRSYDYGSSEDGYYTKMSFFKNDKYGGTGYEYDYPKDTQYYYSSGVSRVSFEWYVQNGNIFIKYEDTQWKTFVIENPYIGSDEFSGVMYETSDNGGINYDKQMQFRFTRASAYSQSPSSWRAVKKK